MEAKQSSLRRSKVNKHWMSKKITWGYLRKRKIDAICNWITTADIVLCYNISPRLKAPTASRIYATNSVELVTTEEMSYFVGRKLIPKGLLTKAWKPPQNIDAFLQYTKESRRRLEIAFVNKY